MIGLLKPKNWNESPLGEVAEIERTSVTAQNIETGTKYVGLEHLDSEGRILAVQTVNNGELASNKFVFGPKHILYGKLRPYLRKIVRPDFDGVCSTDILPIRATKVDRGYLFHYLRHPRVVEYATGRCEGANLPRISPSEIEKFPVHFPPSLPEQRRIADILDKADGIRRKRREAIASCDQLQKSAFRAAHGDPATNPHGWPKKKLGEVVNFVGGSQPPKDTFIPEPREGYVRLVQIRDFKTDGYPTYIPRDMSRRSFEKDDVMIARYGPPVFQILRGLSGSYNVALMKAEPTEHTTKDFLFHLLQIPEIHGVVVANSTRTAGQSGVNLDLLGNIVIPIPPVKRQIEISRTLKSIDAISSKATRLHQDANALFNSLVQRAFRGEL
jgi:type I restriction enzyme S subunit